jgi:hypothetical protein
VRNAPSAKREAKMCEIVLIKHEEERIWPHERCRQHLWSSDMVPSGSEAAWSVCILTLHPPTALCIACCLPQCPPLCVCELPLRPDLSIFAPKARLHGANPSSSLSLSIQPLPGASRQNREQPGDAKVTHNWRHVSAAGCRNRRTDGLVCSQREKVEV